MSDCACCASVSVHTPSDRRHCVHSAAHYPVHGGKPLEPGFHTRDQVYLWPATVSGTFHSLSRVLVTVRSYYLCTIGQGTVFSLRGDTPSISSCSTKKLYSSNAMLIDSQRSTRGIRGCHPVLQQHFHADLVLPTEAFTIAPHRYPAAPILTSRAMEWSLGWVMDNQVIQSFFTRRY